MGNIKDSTLATMLRFSSSKRLNLVMQTEASECGLACVTMIANFHGNQISIDQLRQLNPISSQGSNLTQLFNKVNCLTCHAEL